MSRQPRKDAVRHRVALLEAGRRVFSEQGVHVSLDAVVAEAGLGRGTLYRHFPDRAALLVAVFEAELDDLEAASAQHPPEAQIGALLREVVELAERAPALSEAWRTISDHPAMAENRARFRAMIARSIDAAVAAGRLRVDTTVDEILLAARMLAAAIHNCGGDEALKAAAFKIIREGIKGPSS